ncbi:unnamed protein product, partial [Brassica rapa subsp. trilocularis]
VTEVQSSISPSPKPETKTFIVVTPDSSKLFSLHGMCLSVP